MPEAKTERLLNLVICLLATRRYLSVQQIRAAVPGYVGDGERAGSEEAFRRMFERDKRELRELGVPLETGTDAMAHDDEPGYRIARSDYELPQIALQPDEAAALGLAARLWQSASLAGAAGSALLKLAAAGVDVHSGEGTLTPRVAASEPAFDACLAAVRDGRQVRFGYRTAGRPGVQQRLVQPWGVVSWHGRWYLVGHDEARAAERVFRLSRFSGQVRLEGEPGSVSPPENLDLRAVLARAPAEAATSTARVRVRRETCWALRAEASSITADGEADLLEIGFADPERLADRIAGFGADAVVLAPEPARQAVLRRWRAVLPEKPE